MRRPLLLLLALLGCGPQEEARTPGTQVAEARIEEGVAPPASPTPAEPAAAKSSGTLAKPDASAAPTSPRHPPAPADTLPPPPNRLALRSYERLLNGRRAATMRVEWTSVERDGRRLVQDVTETRTATDRDMAGMRERFTSKSISTTLRTEDGGLVSQETVEDLPNGRRDAVRIERTAAGYKVTRSAGPNEETFEIATEEAVVVDAEAFLGSRIRAGVATPGATFRLPQLDTGRRRVAEGTLTVVGPDTEGPGLKVVESLEGQDALWWFAEDGSVVRLRAGDTIIRRNDSVGLDDLPKRTAVFRSTLPSNIDLPRLFTTRQMVVHIRVRTDDTTKSPRIPESPFTEVLERTDEQVIARLKMHDDPAATCALPIDPKGLEEYLKPTPLMEVDDPDVRALAKRLLGDAKDARDGARRIAEYVFSALRKGSPAIPDPTAKEILRERTGDCSEHSLLFTALCRAAGIPARRCSGWVCVGGDWGGHGWCEIWVGLWIGADPTTNEIGTRARYILCSRPDETDLAPAGIIAERTQIVIRRAEYEDGAVEIDDGAFDPASRDPVVFSGIRLGPTPEGWTVTHSESGAHIEAPDFTAAASLHPDQGYRSVAWLTRNLPRGKGGVFGGRPAAVSRMASGWVVSLGREILEIRVDMHGSDAELPEAALVKLFAPTLERQD